MLSILISGPVVYLIGPALGYSVYRYLFHKPLDLRQWFTSQIPYNLIGALFFTLVMMLLYWRFRHSIEEYDRKRDGHRNSKEDQP